MAKQQLRCRSVRAPDALWNWIKAQAKAEDRPVNWMVLRLLEQAQKREAQHG